VQALALAVLTFTDTAASSPDRARPFSRGDHRFETPTRQRSSGTDRAQGGPANAIALAIVAVPVDAFRRAVRFAGRCWRHSGEAWCFVLNALFYLAIIVTYAIVRVKPRKRLDTGASGGASLASGFATPSLHGPRRSSVCSSRDGIFFTAPWSSADAIFAGEPQRRLRGPSAFLYRRVGLGAILGTFALRRAFRCVALAG